jgi:hypothetical protein
VTFEFEIKKLLDLISHLMHVQFTVCRKGIKYSLLTAQITVY